MRFTTRVAIGATISAGVLFGTGHLASATSIDEAKAAIQNLNNELDHAARMNTPASMRNACGDVADAGYDLLTLARPKAMPRVVWAHTRKAARYTVLSAEACVDGDFDTASEYSDQATDEWDASVAALKKYTG